MSQSTTDPAGGVRADSGADLGGPFRTTLAAFGVGVAGFALGFVVLFLSVNLLAVAGLIGEEIPGVLVFLLSVVTLQGLGFPLVTLAYLRWRDLDVSFLRIRTPSARDLGLVVAGLVGVFALVLLCLQLIQVLGLTAAERGDAELFQQREVAIVAIPVMLLIVGPGEELLFRGVIQTTLKEEFSTAAAIALASLAFAPAHILVYLGTGASATAIAVSLSVLFFPSLVFGAVYERSDNLVVPSLSHGLYNAILIVILLSAPAQEMPQGLLL